jgi:hypothetical protein
MLNNHSARADQCFSEGYYHWSIVNTQTREDLMNMDDLYYILSNQNVYRKNVTVCLQLDNNVVEIRK